MTEDKSQTAPVLSPKDVKRRQYLIVAGVVILVIIIGFGSMLTEEAPRERPQKPIEKSIEAPGRTLGAKDVWIAKSEERLAQSEQQNAELVRRIAALEKQLTESALAKPGEKSASGSKPPLTAIVPPSPNAASFPPVPTIPVASAQGGAAQPIFPPPAAGVSKAGGGGSGAPTPGRGIHLVSLEAPPEQSSKDVSTAAQGGGKGGTSEREVGRWIPAGSFTRGTLLGGLDAPAGGQAQSNPHPVLVKLQNNSILPNRFRTRTRECHVVGAGYGDISSERAYIRLETLSCVLKTGKILEVAVSGYIAGEDGKTGMRGELRTKEGQLLSRAFLAGLGAGIGDGLADSVTTLSTSPLGTTKSVDPGKILEHGAYSGVGKAMDRLAQYYITMAEKTFPIIEIAAGRPVDVVFTKGVALEEDINEAWDDVEHEAMADEGEEEI